MQPLPLSFISTKFDSLAIPTRHAGPINGCCLDLGLFSRHTVPDSFTGSTFHALDPFYFPNSLADRDIIIVLAFQTGSVTTYCHVDRDSFATFVAICSPFQPA